MEKTLIDIDTVYREILMDGEIITDHERASYCRRTIDKAQMLLEATRRYLSSEQRQQHIDRILAAQKELKRLNRIIRIKSLQNTDAFQMA